MKNLILTLLMTVVLTNTAHADIISTSGDYIRISTEGKGDNKIYSFEFCHDYKSLIEDSFANCPNGKLARRSFTYKELKTQKRWEIFDLVGTIAADAGILVGTLGVASLGSAFGGVASSLGIPGFAASTSLDIFLTGALTTGVSMLVDRLNPVTQYRDIKSLSKEVLSDKNIFVKKEKTFDRLVKNLESVLSDI